MLSRGSRVGPTVDARLGKPSKPIRGLLQLVTKPGSPCLPAAGPRIH